MLAALANVLEAALDAQVRVMALDLFYLLVKQVKVVDDLAQIQLIYSMQVVAQDLVGTLDLPVERTLAPHGPRERRLVIPTLRFLRQFLTRFHVAVGHLSLEGELIHALIV